jgi:two-component system response regulator CpxR
VTTAELRAADAPIPELPHSEEGRSILLVLGDSELVSRLRCTLVAGGFTVRSASPVTASQGFVLNPEHSLVILDAGRGRASNVDAVRRLRARAAVPILVLSSCRDREELVEMLESGADDYVGEPIDLDEVLARVRAVLRRCSRFSGHTPPRLDIGAIAIATKARSVRVRGEAVALTSVEYEVLEYLARHAGRAIPRDELMAAVGRRHASPFDRAVDVHVSHLRRKLRQHGRQIRTIRGVGYMLVAAEPEPPIAV